MLLLVASALIELSRCLEALQPSPSRGAAWTLCLCPSLSLLPTALWLASLRSEPWCLNVFFELSCGEGTP